MARSPKIESLTYASTLSRISSAQVFPSSTRSVDVVGRIHLSNSVNSLAKATWKAKKYHKKKVHILYIIFIVLS